MNFLIEPGFYLCTFNLKDFESIHSPFKHPRQAFNISCWCFHQTVKSSLGGCKNLRILHHLNSQLTHFDFCFFICFFFFLLLQHHPNLDQVQTVLYCQCLPCCKSHKYWWLVAGNRKKEQVGGAGGSAMNRWC